MMKNEGRPFAWFVDFCRTACQEYGRFAWVFYGGEALVRAADLVPKPSREVVEKAP
ncbi:hypothetical protein [Micromonospora sp. RTGN7]|uniref:hypothetical protein n=1 Tax=Micromonospora sp. RTGN7 TaxID=3016526 RepID=UPI0029FECDA4|nr:hypothetical protein [Micromonospora sp. RTGN7]